MDPREPVVQFLTVTRERLRLCIEDVTDGEARRMPARALAPIAWQLGHVAWADALYVGRAGGTLTLPPRHADLFKPGTGGSADYPPLKELWEVFEGAHHALVDAARTADFATPLEHPAYRNVGEMLAYSSLHRSYHTGKITSLRALLGKPVLFGPPLGSSAR